MLPCTPFPVPKPTGLCDHFNGYYWKLLDDDQRRQYIIAVRETVWFVVTKMVTGTKDADAATYRKLLARFWPWQLLTPEIEIALDEFYATPENLGVPILNALQLVAAKAAGVGEATIRQQAEEFRRLVVEQGTRK